MKTIVESTNFEPSKTLNEFVLKKSAAFEKLDHRALYAEFNLSATKHEYTCTIILNLAGKDVIASRSSGDMYYSISKAVEAAKRGMRKKKMKRLTAKKKKQINEMPMIPKNHKQL